MSASADKLYGVADAAPADEISARSRIAMTSPLIAYSAAAAGSVAAWIVIFKLIFD